MLKFFTAKKKFIRFCYFVSIYQHITFLETTTCVTCFLLLLKIALFNTVQM